MAHNSVNVVGSVNTRVTGGSSKEFAFKNRLGGIPGGETKTILDVDTPYTIDYLEWATNHEEDVRIEIATKNEEFPNGTSITRTVSRIGERLVTYSNPRNILNHKSGIWDILDYDENANAYKFRFNLQGLEFAKGVRISLINDGSTNRYGAIIMYGRELR